MGRAALLLGIGLLAVAPACKKSESKDAGVPQATPIADAELGFKIEVPPTWSVVAPEAAPAGTTVSRVAEAHRRPLTGRAYLVAPRLVVTAEPTRAPDAESAIRATMNDLKGLEDQRGVRINRTSMSARVIEGVTVGDIELSYDVKDPSRDTAREVVHRSLVTLRPRSDGSNAVLTFTMTYLAEDSELVGAEIQYMIATLGFPRRGPGGAARSGEAK